MDSCMCGAENTAAPTVPPTPPPHAGVKALPLDPGSQHVLHLGVVVEELDVARLKEGLQPQLVAGGQLVKERDGLQLGRREAGHLRVPLAQEEVVVAEVD